MTQQKPISLWCSTHSKLAIRQKPNFFANQPYETNKRWPQDYLSSLTVELVNQNKRKANYDLEKKTRSRDKQGHM